jgi:hypothetical protein
LVSLIDVVILLEHVDEQRLSEATRTDEKEEMAGIFYLFDVLGFVYIVVIIAND